MLVADTRAASVTQQRLAKELTDRGVNHAFVRVPADYYDHDLEYRRQCLGAHSVNSLCKTIVMENTKAPDHFGISSDPTISKYVCVITQVQAPHCFLSSDYMLAQ